MICTKESFRGTEAALHVREITAAEWRDYRALWRMYLDWGPQEADIDIISEKGGRMSVVLDNDRAVARACRLPRPDATDEIDSVWVTPTRRGQGLATQLVTQLTAMILREGRSASYRAVNEASLRVAEKVGYRIASPR